MPTIWSQSRGEGWNTPGPFWGHFSAFYSSPSAQHHTTIFSLHHHDEVISLWAKFYFNKTNVRGKQMVWQKLMLLYLCFFFRCECPSTDIGQNQLLRAAFLMRIYKAAIHFYSQRLLLVLCGQIMFCAWLCPISLLSACSNVLSHPWLTCGGFLLFPV